MANYAKVLDGKVVEVIVADADFFTTFRDTSPGTWLQTSFNTHGNVHYGANGQPDGGIALRGNYAGIGYTYNSEVDKFYAPKPEGDWVLDTRTWTWVAA